MANLYQAINSSMSIYGLPDSEGGVVIDGLIAAYNTANSKSLVKAHGGLVKIQISDRRMVMLSGVPLGGLSQPSPKSNSVSYSILVMDGSSLTSLVVCELTNNLAFKTDVYDAAGSTGVEATPMTLKSYRYNTSDELELKVESSIDTPAVKLYVSQLAKLQAYNSIFSSNAGSYVDDFDIQYALGHGKSNPAKKYVSKTMGQTFQTPLNETLMSFKCSLKKIVTYNSINFDLDKVFCSDRLLIKKIWPSFAMECVDEK